MPGKQYHFKLLNTVALGLIFLITGAVFQAFSLDFGGVLDNKTALSVDQNSTEFSQQDRLSLWVYVPINDFWTFSSQANYLWALDDPVGYGIDEFALRGVLEPAPGSIFTLSAGRQRFTDPTSILLNEPGDGIDAGFAMSGFDIRLAGAYTGLVFRENNELFLSAADQSDFADENLLLSPPRLLAAGSVTATELFFYQSPYLSVLSQFDLRPDTELNEGEGRVNTQYWGAGIGGPLGPTLFYDAFFYFNTGTTLTDVDGGKVTFEESSIYAYLTGIGLRWFVPEVMQSRLSFQGLLASGDKDSISTVQGNTSGDALQFVPLTNPELGLIFSPDLANLLVFDLAYSIKPFREQTGGRKPAPGILSEFQPELRSLVVFRPTTGAVSRGGINPDSDAMYLGTEVDLALKFRPASDLGFSLTSGLFLPNSGGSNAAFLEETGPAEFALSFDLSMSF
ncbi:MAG: hypothetical protein K9L68_09930 [Spirochaetales bacterium]|nr:hypothetical protein [Spirochaetales bacterium]MCF7938901.1 hypothetical protein [Spirochaetales bacterium]